MPSRTLKDKKGLGVTGTNFEPLGPKLAERAAELGYTKRGKLGRDPDAVSSTDSDGDTDMSDSSSSSDDDDAVVEGADFVPLNIGKKVPRFPIVEDSGEDKENKTAVNGVEPNPYFVVDTNPTPVVLNGDGSAKSKKRAKEKDGEGTKSKKAKRKKDAVSEASQSVPVEPEVDFTALEAKLQAEVDQAEAAKGQEAAESSEEKKSKKKRRRSSDGDELVEKKKVKKEKSKKVEDAVSETIAEPSILAEETASKESGKKRKLSDSASGDDLVDKKVKKEKKEKKRKAGADADGADVGDGKKKKRKHKVDSESE